MQTKKRNAYLDLGEVSSMLSLCYCTYSEDFVEI